MGVKSGLSNARSAPCLQTKTGCLSLLVCYSMETELTKEQLFLIGFLDVVAFTKEVECGLLLSETRAAPDGPGPALALWFLSFRPVQPMEVVQAPTWLILGRWEHPLVSSASGSAAEKQAHRSGAQEPLSSATVLLPAHPWPRASCTAGQMPRPSFTQHLQESIGGLCFCHHRD